MTKRKDLHDEHIDAPPASAAPPAEYSELLANMPTDELVRLRAALRSHIPGDPTFAAAVSRILGYLIDANVVHPDRTKRDQEYAAWEADERKRRDAEALAARHAAEVAALPEDHPDRAALDERHAAEQQVLERDRRLAELDAQQAAEREEFAAKQSAARAEATAASA